MNRDCGLQLKRVLCFHRCLNRIDFLLDELGYNLLLSCLYYIRWQSAVSLICYLEKMAVETIESLVLNKTFLTLLCTNWRHRKLFSMQYVRKVLCPLKLFYLYKNFIGQLKLIRLITNNNFFHHVIALRLIFYHGYNVAFKTK